MDHALHSVSVRERSKASPHEVMQLLAQVSRDLQPWNQSGITQEMVERAYCSWDINGESMRVQVRKLRHRFLILFTAAGLASSRWALGQPCTQALSLKHPHPPLSAKTGGHVSRLQIIGGQVYVVPPHRVFQERPKPAQVQLAALALRFDLPDVDFMLSTTDICPTAQQPHPSHNISTEMCPQLVRGMVLSP